MKGKKVNKYNVIGIMSGTSLDGIDIAYCHFNYEKGKWNFSIDHAKTHPYGLDWKTKLAKAHLLSGESLKELDVQYGKMLGQLCVRFIRQKKIKKIDLIASHGHTIFHQPKKRFTFQIGNGNVIHSQTNLPVVFDFRSLDVALGGEGAPLVPIGDQFLFGDYDVCVNLGGIANLSMNIKGERKAFDICFCNMMLNHLSTKIGKSFDHDGNLAQEGKVHTDLLHSLEKLYLKMKKKSLGREIFESQFQVLVDNESIPLHDRLRTVCESIADQIKKSIQLKAKIKLLVTGGGALNRFLISILKQKLGTEVNVVLPSKTIINFKEALVFSFLGVLRIRNEINVLKSVTGASRNSCSGVLIG